MTSPVRILSTPLTVAAALLACACSRGGPAVDVRGEALPAGGTPVAVRVLVRPDHRHYTGRFLAGAIEAIRTIENDYGAYGDSAATLVDRDWRGQAELVPGALQMEPVRWWTTDTAMAPELAAARAVAGRFWTGVLKTGNLPPWLRDALAELTARRASAALFERDNLTPGYAFAEARYFGGFVPRFVRIRIKIETDGEENAAYRAHPRVDMTIRARSPQERVAQTGKAILTLLTLERWIGRPASDDVLRKFAGALREHAIDLADFEQMASDVSGQDLSWLFDAAFRTTGEFDYGIAAVGSTPDGDGYIATVTAVREGDALFTGSSRARIGPFERGGGIAVQAMFANGQRVIDYWDGRDRARTFRYRSPAPIVQAIADPDRLLLLDLKQTHNNAAAERGASAAATAWALRYALWLQNLVLTYAGLV